MKFVHLFLLSLRLGVCECVCVCVRARAYERERERHLFHTQKIKRFKHTETAVQSVLANIGIHKSRIDGVVDS